MNCVFGIDAGRAFKYVLYYDTGTIWCLDDPKQSPLYCIPNVITQDDNLYARVLKQVVVNAQRFALIEVGTINLMPPMECTVKYYVLVQTTFGWNMVLLCYKVL